MRNVRQSERIGNLSALRLPVRFVRFDIGHDRPSSVSIRRIYDFHRVLLRADVVAWGMAGNLGGNILGAVALRTSGYLGAPFVGCDPLHSVSAAQCAQSLMQYYGSA